MRGDESWRNSPLREILGGSLRTGVGHMQSEERHCKQKRILFRRAKDTEWKYMEIAVPSDSIVGDIVGTNAK